jgi:hypothetical protein
MNILRNSLSILFFGVSLIWAQVCFSQQHGPEEVYRQYRMILSTSDDFDSLAGLLSSRTLETSHQYIEKMKSRGISEAEAKSALFGGRKRHYKYEKNRKQIDFHQSGDRAIITYKVEEENIPNHFKNKPTVDSVATIEKTIEEVHFINENGWKIDHTVIKPVKSH